MGKQVALRFTNKAGSVVASISVLSFKEDNTFIVYTPQLDISGYGNTYEEALNSFENSLEMFLDYTTNKNTLYKTLSDLGWKLIKGSEKKPKKISAPLLSQLIIKNDYLADLLNNQSLQTSSKEVVIPI
ncbi:hypothetical protein [Myroides odoratimimus]|uniref:hypothetical protein n=1 Tax=Myroides odoratimimus TaxID=76832 RepID=UPI002578D925|nr:hypothetical protein [Myroides odoratimimus]MDM1500156.1 hypothetical protein [Myroides odoratimimus]